VVYRISRSALLEDYANEKNDVVLRRDEIWSLKNNVGMIRDHYANVLTRITKKLLLKHRADGFNQLLNLELVASLGDPVWISVSLCCLEMPQNGE